MHSIKQCIGSHAKFNYYMAKQQWKIDPVKFKTCNLNENKTKQLAAELEKINWSDRLQFNVLESASDKYKKFNAIENSIGTVAPENIVCISAKNRYVEPWVTQGLKITSKEKLRLYKLRLSTDGTDEVHQNYVSYRNKYNKLKHVLRLNYYNSKCIQYKNNIKQLWEVIIK